KNLKLKNDGFFDGIDKDDWDLIYGGRGGGRKKRSDLETDVSGFYGNGYCDPIKFRCSYKKK
uniref:Uncharacterized protein n=1 Tax=Acrobeloides nanus TaxID=290746 RepID=A0A914DIL4_9BILA